MLGIDCKGWNGKKLWKTQGENISSSLEMKNGCYFCPNQPIDDFCGQIGQNLCAYSLYDD